MAGVARTAALTTHGPSVILVVAINTTVRVIQVMQERGYMRRVIWERGNMRMGVHLKHARLGTTGVDHTSESI